jgi:Spx/MgsR family transcriptional regulator
LITVYGIRQCDSCHKALKWLSEHNVPHRFHDFRVQGLDKALVSRWLDSEFGDMLMNRRSTTWRTLSQAQKDAQGAAKTQLMVDHPTLVKRPVFVDGSVLAVGFSPARLLPLIKAL